ncbi:MAG: hypothetical protein ACTSVO_14770 [Candidatus Heimdallarchaeaceae archaeon]
MPAIANCSFCSSPAQYYCKSCKRKLCSDHIIISNTVYHCDNCKEDRYDQNCHVCGKETTTTRHEPVHRCDWCKSASVEDGLLYYQQLPQLIFSSVSLLHKKLSKVWKLTKHYVDVVDTVYGIRKAKIMLFADVEDEITLLRSKIATFIDHLVKFENETFTMVDEKLRNIGYMRYTNLNNIEKAEEVLVLMENRLKLLDNTLENKFEGIETDFNILNQKVNYLKFQFGFLKKIHQLLPDNEKEELIAVIPRVWLKKNRKIAKKYLLIFTSQNLYLMREKGLFDVKLRTKEAISLSYIISKKYISKLLSGKTFRFKTRLDSYVLYGRKVALEQILTYFQLVDNYIDFSIHKSSIIEDLKDYSLTISELKSNIQRNHNHLRTYLLNKRELKKELYWREGQDAKFNKLFEQLLAVERKVHRLNQSRRYGGRSTRGIDGLLSKLTVEHNRLKQQMENVRRKSDEFDDMWEI